MRPTDVFIHSSPHSGSTWFGYVLGSGRETAFVGELYRAWDAQDRVPCTICAARGLPECTLLGGIEHADPTEAFSTISERSGKRVIVENSKRTEWTSRFIGRADRDLRVVHLLKDPRSRWASLRRRENADLGACMDVWWRENQEIRQFTVSRNVQTMIVAYDIVAANPDAAFPEIFAFLGARYEADVLRYWEIDHHGFAANGASSAIVQHHKFSAPPEHFSTADDGYYRSMFGRSFVDERWRSEVPPDECDAILKNDRIGSLLQELGYGLTPTGLERVDGHGFALARRILSLGRRMRGSGWPS